MTAATSSAPGEGLHQGMPEALRIALADDVENLIVSMIEAVLVSGLGFRGPFEDFRPAVEDLVLDALGSARRDGARIANEAAADTVVALTAECASLRSRVAAADADLAASRVTEAAAGARAERLASAMRRLATAEPLGGYGLTDHGEMRARRDFAFSALRAALAVQPPQSASPDPPAGKMGSGR